MATTMVQKFGLAARARGAVTAGITEAQARETKVWEQYAAYQQIIYGALIPALREAEEKAARDMSRHLWRRKEVRQAVGFNAGFGYPYPDAPEPPPWSLRDWQNFQRRHRQERTNHDGKPIAKWAAEEVARLQGAMQSGYAFYGAAAKNYTAAAYSNQKRAVLEQAPLWILHYQTCEGTQADALTLTRTLKEAETRRREKLAGLPSKATAAMQGAAARFKEAFAGVMQAKKELSDASVGTLAGGMTGAPPGQGQAGVGGTTWWKWLLLVGAVAAVGGIIYWAVD